MIVMIMQEKWIFLSKVSTKISHLQHSRKLGWGERVLIGSLRLLHLHDEQSWNTRETSYVVSTSSTNHSINQSPMQPIHPSSQTIAPNHVGTSSPNHLQHDLLFSLRIPTTQRTISVFLFILSSRFMANWFTDQDILHFGHGLWDKWPSWQKFQTLALSSNKPYSDPLTSQQPLPDYLTTHILPCPDGFSQVSSPYRHGWYDGWVVGVGSDSSSVQAVFRMAWWWCLCTHQPHRSYIHTIATNPKPPPFHSPTSLPSLQSNPILSIPNQSHHSHHIHGKVTIRVFIRHRRRRDVLIPLADS